MNPYRFDPEEHSYYHAERKLCGVTEVLTAQGILPTYDGLDPYYMDRGSAVHSAIALYADSRLDESSVTEAIAPYLHRARRLLELWDAEPIFVEQPLFDGTLGYGGTPDMVLRRRKPGRLIVVDWKTGGIQPGHAVQVAGAYRSLLISAAREKSIPCEVDELMRAEYVVVPLTAEIPRPWTIEGPEKYPALFRAALAVYQWRKANLREVKGVAA